MPKLVAERISKGLSAYNDIVEIAPCFEGYSGRYLYKLENNSSKELMITLILIKEFLNEIE